MYQPRELQRQGGDINVETRAEQTEGDNKGFEHIQKPVALVSHLYSPTMTPRS